MPELPEIETLKCSLEPHILNKTIIEIEKKRNKLRYDLPNNFDLELANSKIIKIWRRAKYLILELNNNYSLIIHLGMSGRFTLQPFDYSIKKHDHIIFKLENQRLLVFNDPRRFGMVYILPTANLANEKIFSNLGVEPLSDEFNANYLLTKLAKKNTPIKNAIMDNRSIVGVGNIYAAESLFQAKINPLRASHSLNIEEVQNLVNSIKKVLKKAILAGGTTLKDFVNGENRPGFFKQELLIYNQTGKNCKICSEIILKIKQAGRTTFYCLNCQK